MDEEISEAVETIVKESKGLLPVALGLLAFGAGVGLGYILGRRSKPPEIITLAPRDPETTRPRKVIIDEVPEKTVTEEPEDVILLNQKTVETTNVFAASSTHADVWDIDEEIKRRSPHRPYVLHQEEFFAEEMEAEDFIQTTLTYYAGDDVLVDDSEKPIYNRTEIVGDTLDKFGHGSGDPNCVYVRNMERRMEYEVIRDLGKYSVEVLGLEDEQEDLARDLKHAKTPRRFPRSD